LRSANKLAEIDNGLRITAQVQLDKNARLISAVLQECLLLIVVFLL